MGEFSAGEFSIYASNIKIKLLISNYYAITIYSKNTDETIDEFRRVQTNEDESLDERRRV